MSVSRTIRSVAMVALLLGGAGLLSGCEETGSANSYRAFAPIPVETVQLMEAKGTVKDAPMLIRAYKKEAELEIWKRKADGKYVFLKTFPMCRWSGQLGPKVTEGDRQVPEGFYTITPGQMNPNSHYYLSFNVGYPNAYDRANGHTGGSIMVHGICSSAGCFSMTDKAIEEIYAIARESFAGGQRSIQMQSYPFRMTAENMAKLRLDPNMPFWRELKKGADYFELTKTETPVGVCNRHYVFGATPKGDERFDALSNCPPLNEDPEVKALVSAKEKQDEAEVAALVAKGVKPVRIIYADGGQNAQFANRITEVSRPDALAAGPTEIALDDGVKAKSVAVQIAAAKANAKVLLAKGNYVTVPGATAVASTTPANTTGSIKAPAAPVTRVAQAEPAAFTAAPSAYAKTEPKAEQPNFFSKWLKVGEAAKPEAEASAAVPVSEPATPRPAAVPLPPRRAVSIGSARPATAQSASKPEAAKPEQLSSALPKEITDKPAEKSAFLSNLMALAPGFN
jgi:murein L,D-transpeptidase YafK